MAVPLNEELRLYSLGRAFHFRHLPCAPVGGGLKHLQSFLCVGTLGEDLKLVALSCLQPQQLQDCRFPGRSDLVFSTVLDHAKLGIEASSAHVSRYACECRGHRPSVTVLHDDGSLRFGSCGSILGIRYKSISVRFG